MSSNFSFGGRFRTYGCAAGVDAGRRPDVLSDRGVGCPFDGITFGQIYKIPSPLQ